MSGGDLAVGQPFPLGVNYWPRRKAMYWWQHFERDEVAEEFDLIADLGLRLVRIFLTEKGLEKKEVSRRTVKQFNHKVREQVPQEDLDVFFNVCGRILGMIENKEIF